MRRETKVGTLSEASWQPPGLSADISHVSRQPFPRIPQATAQSMAVAGYAELFCFPFLHG